jgi:hypothetical protein
LELVKKIKAVRWSSPAGQSSLFLEKNIAHGFVGRSSSRLEGVTSVSQVHGISVYDLIDWDPSYDKHAG